MSIQRLLTDDEEIEVICALEKHYPPFAFARIGVVEIRLALRNNIQAYADLARMTDLQLHQLLHFCHSEQVCIWDEHGELSLDKLNGQLRDYEFVQKMRAPSTTSTSGRLQ